METKGRDTDTKLLQHDKGLKQHDVSIKEQDQRQFLVESRVNQFESMGTMDVKETHPIIE